MLGLQKAAKLPSATHLFYTALMPLHAVIIVAVIIRTIRKLSQQQTTPPLSAATLWGRAALHRHIESTPATPWPMAQKTWDKGRVLWSKLRKFGVRVVVENRGEAGHVAAAGLDMQGPRRWSEPSAVLILADVRRLAVSILLLFHLHDGIHSSQHRSWIRSRRWRSVTGTAILFVSWVGARVCGTTRGRGSMTVDTGQRTRQGQGLGFGRDKEGERVRCWEDALLLMSPLRLHHSLFLLIRNSPVLNAVFFHLLFFHFFIATTLPSFAGAGSRLAHLTDAKLVCFLPWCRSYATRGSAALLLL